MTVPARASILAVLAAAILAACASPPGDAPLAFVHVNVVPMDSERVLEEIIYTYQPIVDVIGPLLDLQFGRVEPAAVEDALAALPDLRPRLAPAVERLAAEALGAGLAVTPTLVAFETIWRQTTPQYAALLEAPETRYMSPLTRVDWGPDFNRYRTGWADRLEAVEQVLRRSLELQKTIVRGFQDAGVPLMIGTDAPLTFVSWGSTATAARTTRRAASTPGAVDGDDAQAIRTQRMSVLKSGGFPNIRMPMRNTLAANHKAA